MPTSKNRQKSATSGKGTRRAGGSAGRAGRSAARPIPSGDSLKHQGDKLGEALPK